MGNIICNIMYLHDPAGDVSSSQLTLRQVPPPWDKRSSLVKPSTVEP